MEIEEAKKWIMENDLSGNLNLRSAFLLTVEYIYKYSDSKIVDIGAFWKWYLDEWNTCREIVGSGNTLSNCADFLSMNMIVKHHIKPMFGISTSFRIFVNSTHARFSVLSYDIMANKSCRTTMPSRALYISHGIEM